MVVYMFGEGNGTPLQYSCLENPMDGGAWKATVHGVAEGRTRLSNFTFTFHFHALEKEMATHSSVLAWRIAGTEHPGGLPLWGCTESDTTEVTQQQQQCICFHVIKLGFEAIAAGLQIPALFLLGSWGKRERSKNISRAANVFLLVSLEILFCSSHSF